MTRQEQLEVYVAKHTTQEIKNEVRQLLLKDKRKLLKEYNRLNNKFYYYRDVLNNDFMTKVYRDLLYDLKQTFDYARYRIVFDDIVNALNASKRDKHKRIKKRIASMILNNNAYFYTLTFTDKVLANTNEETRRRYVQRFLKANSTNYVANIDFGDENGREHYHVVANVFIDESLWTYGIMRVRKIADGVTDVKKISHYVTKLSFHAIKDTTIDYSNKFRLIYSRN